MKFSWEKLFYLLGSLIMAILLSVYTTGRSDSYGMRNSSTSISQNSLFTNNETAKISVPIQITGIDTNKYLVEGVPDDIDVKVTGSTALVTAVKNTKNFTVYIDLNALNEGNHTVPLKVQGLNRSLTYELSKQNLNIAIHKRSVAYYTVEPVYNEDAIATGYNAGTPTSSVTNVEIMGRANLVEDVSRVVANVQLPRSTTSTTTHTVELKALDNKGNPVDVTISPAVTTVRVPVKAGTGDKTVPVKFNTKNGNANDFDITADVNEFTVHGNMAVLNKLNNIEVPVDLKNITSTQQISVEVKTPDGAESITPNTINVTITPKE